MLRDVLPRQARSQCLRERVPNARGDVPNACGDVPNARGDVPSACGDVPSACVGVPIVRVDVPIVRKDVPDARVDVPSVPEDVPSASGDVPSARGDVPSAREGVPGVHKDVPRLVYQFSAFTANHASAEGDWESNMTLSQQRAERIVREMVRRGVSPYRLVPVGYGESEARHPADAAESLREQDRRVVVYKLGDEPVASR